MNPILVFLLIVALVIFAWWGMFMLKVKFAMNMWFRVKSIFGTDFYKQASKKCKGSTIPIFTDKNDSKLLDYLNGTLWCPLDREAHEANVVKNCKTAKIYYPPEVVKKYDQPKVESLESTCTDPTKSTWAPAEVEAWTGVLKSKCSPWNTSNKSLSSSDMYSLYSNTFTGNTPTCP